MCTNATAAKDALPSNICETEDRINEKVPMPTYTYNNF